MQFSDDLKITNDELKKESAKFPNNSRPFNFSADARVTRAVRIANPAGRIANRAGVRVNQTAARVNRAVGKINAAGRIVNRTGRNVFPADRIANRTARNVIRSFRIVILNSIKPSKICPIDRKLIRQFLF
ncbi:MAG: hypothetical protein M3T96_03005 [Acidobacteriota bacterium]|nr:hypothetical protein [Acidobacteriota bacterium]